MNAPQVIEENLELIDRIVARACRRAGVVAGDVADMASTVKLALVVDDYAVLRRYEGRSSLATYLTIVVQRVVANHWVQTRGRWRPSAEAERMGESAVLIEDVVGRQRRTIDEATAIVRGIDPSMTRDGVTAIVRRLPERAPRPREVELPADDVVPLAARERADATLLDGELRDLSRRAGTLLRETMDAWPDDDRLLVRLRFESSLSIADIARLMHVPQRPLYRRLESLLGRLRAVLLEGGIDPATADDLVGAAQRIEMDYGLSWKNGGPSPTNDSTGRGSRGTQS